MKIKLEDITKDKKLLSLIGLIVLLVVFIIIAIFRISGGTKEEKLGKDQIRIEKDGETIIVNSNGLVEYRTGDKVFYRQWDEGRVSSFFSKMRTKAKESKGKEPPSGECYTVTLWLDDELVTFCVSVDDPDLIEELDEIFEEFDEESGEGEDLGDFFDDDNDEDEGTSGPDPTLPPGVTATPTTAGGATPTTSTGGNGGGGNVPLPTEAGCSAWRDDIVGGKAIISSTLCTAFSPTPTP